MTGTIDTEKLNYGMLKDKLDTTDAACQNMDTDIFFPEGRNSTEIQAKTVCASCPIIDSCLTWAVDMREEGVWGGSTTKERKHLRTPRSRQLHIATIRQLAKPSK